jgi:transposase-like protein
LNWRICAHVRYVARLIRRYAIAEIRNAEDKDHAQAAANVFAADYGTGWPKAAAKITDNLEVLLAFYDYPRRALDPPAHHQPDRYLELACQPGP